ncbi:MAG: asparagine synthase (glutamine-hydrolyzing) [Ignavibacteria bacterium]|nr:asparagine synthase (glutamine-hydrolyzing) [Ignavibacteria bacterium]
MCGIVGIIGNLPENIRNEKLNKMLIAQSHRGPDFMNIYSDDNISLGHNRLSIIDLSPDANQPFIDSSGNFILIFNGEIYNYLEIKDQLKSDYKFKSNSDTEVLLASYIKWGAKCTEKLNGMFSFVVYDKLYKKIFAARDRFGVKPFYYTLLNDVFYFASELKAFWVAGIPKEFNFKTLSNYFVYGSYGLPDETFYKNIKSLPAGHSIEFDTNSNNFKIFNWYDFVSNVNEVMATFNSCKTGIEKYFSEKYTELLHDTIDLRFRSDVPVGFNISGGLDSSTLLSLVSHKFPSSSDVNAFTFYSNNSDYDELPWVNELINKTSFPLNKCLLEYNKIPELIKNVSYYQDEPFGGFPTLAMSNIFKTAREKGVIVLLDGQGMDEAWAGYDYYHNNNNSLVQGVSTSPVRPEVLTDEFLKYSEPETYPNPFNDKLKNLQYRDLFYTKIPRALRFNDRISMMHSTELREPFLDYRLVEFAFALPDNLKFKNGVTKWSLREITKKMLGDNIALAPKRLLQTPQREWISKELKNYFNEEVTKFSEHPFINKLVVLNLWENYLNGQNDNSFYIWQWINYNNHK